MMKIDCIVVLGKRPSSGAQPMELMARAAMASIYWHNLDQKVKIFCVEGYDIDGSTKSGSEITKEIAITKGQIPEQYTIVKSHSNCTSREVVAIKEVMDAHKLSYALVITHPYHVRRARKYLAGAGIQSDVRPCSLGIIQRGIIKDLSPELVNIIQLAEPGKIQLIREHIAEMILSIIHFFDPAGQFERFLSDRIRGKGIETPSKKTEE